MRPVDVTRIQGPRLLVGLSLLVQPVVELKHAVHPTSPAGIIGHHATRLGIHPLQNPARKWASEMATMDDDGGSAAGRKQSKHCLKR